MHALDLKKHFWQKDNIAIVGYLSNVGTFFNIFQDFIIMQKKYCTREMYSFCWITQGFSCNEL